MISRLQIYRVANEHINPTAYVSKFGPIIDLMQSRLWKMAGGIAGNWWWAQISTCPDCNNDRLWLTSHFLDLFSVYIRDREVTWVATERLQLAVAINGIAQQIHFRQVGNIVHHSCWNVKNLIFGQVEHIQVGRTGKQRCIPTADLVIWIDQNLNETIWFSSLHAQLFEARR